VFFSPIVDLSFLDSSPFLSPLRLIGGTGERTGYTKSSFRFGAQQSTGRFQTGNL
jgi:hypothetical protein